MINPFDIPNIIKEANDRNEIRKKLDEWRQSLTIEQKTKAKTQYSRKQQ